MIWGYFDESGLHDSKKDESGREIGTGRLLSLTLGGGFARSEAWDELSAGWDAALRRVGVTMFHMKDFAAFRGEFEGWKEREEDRKWLLNELLGLIIQHIPRWIGFVSWSEDTNGTTRAVYGKCIVDSMVLLARDAGHSNDDALALVYAKHPEYSPKTIERHFDDIGQGDPRLRTCVVQEPMGVPPLQAADLVAYEMSRAQRRDGQERSPFLSLKAGLKQFMLEARFAGRSEAILAHERPRIRAT